MSRTASLALIGLALTGCLGTSPTAPPDEVVAGDGVFEGHRPVELGGAALRARAVSGLRVIVDDDAVPFTPARIPSTLRLNLFGDAIHDAVLTDATTHRGTVLWHGEVVGQVGSLVSLAFYDGAVAGTVRVGPRVFAIRPRPGGAVIVEEDDAAVPEGGPPVVPRIDDPEPPMAGDGTPAAAGDAVAEIDILVVYTSAARAGAGDAGIRATIELAVDEANQSFVTSGVPAHFNLLDAVETRYDETDLDYSTTLSRLSNTTDGYLDDVPPLREALGADHVVLLVDHVGSYSGLGYQMTSDNRGSFSRFAYAVVARDYAAGYYTLAHEVGHNMGATHDAAHADQEGFYADSHGHQVPDAGYRTIMAYACTTGSCPRTSVWSSPTLVHEGRPTGVAGVSDNVRTLQTTASITAAFRARPAPVAVAAASVRPTDGASLTGTTATFEWNDVGADEHLFVGRALATTPSSGQRRRGHHRGGAQPAQHRRAGLRPPVQPLRGHGALDRRLVRRLPHHRAARAAHLPRPSAAWLVELLRLARGRRRARVSPRGGDAHRAGPLPLLVDRRHLLLRRGAPRGWSRGDRAPAHARTLGLEHLRRHPPHVDRAGVGGDDHRAGLRRHPPGTSGCLPLDGLRGARALARRRGRDGHRGGGVE
ncbi:MAG: M12 family metallo-peptidase [Sandaracinaceae bacterium]